MCQYILYYECVLFAITSVINDHMCAVFQITDSILSHCGNVSHAFKKWKVLKRLLFIFNRLTPEYFLFICSRVVQNQLNEAAEECLVVGKGVSTILNEAVNMNNL